MFGVRVHVVLYMNPFRSHPPCGVDGFCQRSEGDPSALQRIQKRDEIVKQPPQPVELPHHQRIARGKRRETRRQLWPFDMRTRGLVGEDALASCPLQGSQLQIRILIVC